MSKVHIATISLSSMTMGDLKQQLSDLAHKTQGDGRVYLVGPVYQIKDTAAMGVDISVYIPSAKISEERARMAFESNDIPKVYH